jgi:histone-lysine N-methyltransferase SETMAR
MNFFLSKVITGDETRCFQYDPEILQWKQQTSPRPKKTRMLKSQMKTMLITFLDIKGIVHSEFIPQGQTLNQAYCVDLLKRLREVVSRKRPELWPSDWILHHDNAPAHRALSVKQFLAQKSITQMEHPPYSPDLASNDLWLFPKIKSTLKGRRFQDTEDIKKCVTTALKAIHNRSSKNVSSSSNIVGLSA